VGRRMVHLGPSVNPGGPPGTRIAKTPGATSCEDPRGHVLRFSRARSGPFDRDATGTWARRAYVKASNTGYDDLFGTSVALDGAGTTLAVGASHESSGAIGVDGDQASDAAQHAGAVYLY
jgi:hypothetical protein